MWRHRIYWYVYDVHLLFLIRNVRMGGLELHASSNFSLEGACTIKGTHFYEPLDNVCFLHFIPMQLNT